MTAAEREVVGGLFGRAHVKMCCSLKNKVFFFVLIFCFSGSKYLSFLTRKDHYSSVQRPKLAWGGLFIIIVIIIWLILNERQVNTCLQTTQNSLGLCPVEYQVIVKNQNRMHRHS